MPLTYAERVTLLAKAEDALESAKRWNCLGGEHDLDTPGPDDTTPRSRLRLALRNVDALLAELREGC